MATMTTLPELARDYVQKMISRAGPGAKVILVDADTKFLGAWNAEETCPAPPTWWGARARKSLRFLSPVGIGARAVTPAFGANAAAHHRSVREKGSHY